MSDLAERYGTRRGGRRTPLLVAVVVVAALGGWLAWSTWSYASPQVRSELINREVTGEHGATARIDVRLDADVVATCLVRAFAEDHSVVGERSFEVSREGAGEVEVEIRTERRANAVELVGCTTPDQPRPR